MLRLAHRGDWRRAPENSLAAIVAALSVPGCDGVEFDVRASADGVPVLLHDETLARVQGRPERATDLSAAQLSELGVPTLEAVLDAVPRSAFLDVELKGDPGVEAVVAVLEAARGAELANAAISSFDLEPLRAIGRVRPSWRRWLNAMDLSPETLARAVDLGCAAVSVEWHAIDEAAIERARAAGLEVAAWTVTDEAVADRLAALGVIAACVEGSALEA
jgi:glycerophosphoryl diester phosphodiesterase